MIHFFNHRYFDSILHHTSVEFCFHIWEVQEKAFGLAVEETYLVDIFNK